MVVFCRHGPVAGRSPCLVTSGAYDQDYVSDDGNAVTAHFGQITRVENLDNLLNRS